MVIKIPYESKLFGHLLKLCTLKILIARVCLQPSWQFYFWCIDSVISLIDSSTKMSICRFNLMHSGYSRLQKAFFKRIYSNEGNVGSVYLQEVGMEKRRIGLKFLVDFRSYTIFYLSFPSVKERYPSYTLILVNLKQLNLNLNLNLKQTFNEVFAKPIGCNWKLPTICHLEILFQQI